MNFLIALCSELPDIVALLFGFYDDDINYGKYTNKQDIFLELEKYKREILEDCGWELGLIYNTELTLVEIFIADAKYIEFWGTDEKSFRNIMAEFNLKEIQNIEFIDEYPKIIYPLTTVIDDVVETHEIISNLKDKFVE